MRLKWTKGVSGDEQLLTYMCSEWAEFIHNLPSTKIFQYQDVLNIPFNSSKNIQRHSFCDASQLGNGFCVYVRCEYDKSSTSTHLLLAK